jgi:hypothetical protein
MLITYHNTDGIRKVKKALQEEIEIDDMSSVIYFVGVRIIRN